MIVEGGLALLALAIGALVNFSPIETIELAYRALPTHVAASLWGVAAALPMAVVLLMVETVAWRPIRALRQFVEQSIAPLFAGASLWDLAMISAMAGLGEEMLFRGLLQAGLASWLGHDGRDWIAIAVASVAFGLVHCVTWTYLVVATLVGAYLGLIFWMSGHLLVPIVAHALYDFLALVYFVKVKRPGQVGT
jgi:hypothetical protein